MIKTLEKIFKASCHKNLIIVDIGSRSHPDYTIKGEDLVFSEMKMAMDVALKESATKFAEWCNSNCVMFYDGKWQMGKDFKTRYTTEELYDEFLKKK